MNQKLNPSTTTKEIVRTLVVDAVNHGTRRTPGMAVIHHCGTRFDATKKDQIVINDKKLNLRAVLTRNDAADWSLQFLTKCDDRKLRRLMNSKRWESAINRIHESLPQ